MMFTCSLAHMQTYGLENVALRSANIEYVSHGTVFVTFCVVAGMEVRGLYNIFARLYCYHFLLIKVNYCFGKNVHT